MNDNNTSLHSTMTNSKKSSSKAASSHAQPLKAPTRHPTHIQNKGAPVTDSGNEDNSRSDHHNMRATSCKRQHDTTINDEDNDSDDANMPSEPETHNRKKRVRKAETLKRPRNKGKQRATQIEEVELADDTNQMDIDDHVEEVQAIGSVSQPLSL